MKRDRNKASHPISHSSFNLSLRISPTAAGSSELHGGTNLHCHCVHTDLLLCKSQSPRETRQLDCNRHTCPRLSALALMCSFLTDNCVHLQTEGGHRWYDDTWETAYMYIGLTTFFVCVLQVPSVCNCNMISLLYRRQLSALHSTAVKACKGSCCRCMVHVQSLSSSSVCLGSALSNFGSSD